MSPRYYRPDYLYEVTRRTQGGEFLLDLNDTALMEAIIGSLAIAQRRCKIEIYHFHLMSNHYHGLFNAPSPHQLARFFNIFHGLSGIAVNQRLGRIGPVWKRKFRPLPVTTDAKTLMLRMKYIMGQATRAKLVQHPCQFIGPSAVDWLVAGVPMMGRYNPALTPAAPAVLPQEGEVQAERVADTGAGSQTTRAMVKAIEVKIAILPCFLDQTWQQLHARFMSLADEIAGCSIGQLLADGAQAKIPQVDLAMAGADDDQEEPEDRQTADSDEACPEPQQANPTGVVCEVIAKLPAPDPHDDQTGKRQSRSDPNSRGLEDGKRRPPLEILSAIPSAREAYRHSLSDFRDAYQRAMKRLARQIRRSERGLRVRTVSFPACALLPSCLGAQAQAKQDRN